MTHAILCDAEGIGMSWITRCGKHLVLDLKPNEKLENEKHTDKIDCQNCLTAIQRGKDKLAEWGIK